MAGFRDSIIQINEQALIYNLHYFKHLLKKNQKLILVLKANSYGAGCLRVAQLFDNEPAVSYYAVAGIDEGIELRVSGVTKRIIILNMNIDLFDHALEYDLEPVIINPMYLTRLLDELNNRLVNKEKIAIHINIDTGMHRVGYRLEEIANLASVLNTNKRLFVDTIFSHYVGAGEPTLDNYSNKQYSDFIESVAKLKRLIGYQPKTHLSNSSSTERLKNNDLDLVRIGIGLYGVSIKDVKLKSAFKWKTKIAHIQFVEEGESVSYNRSWIAQRKSKIATVFVGYADGLNRKLSNGNWSMKLGGHAIPIIGDISMDLCMLDITGIEAAIGDELIIIDSVKDVQKMADKLGTISYEIFTLISPRLNRIYISSDTESD